MKYLNKTQSGDHKCTHCGKSNATIIRDGDDPRLKCNSCNFVFNASDSENAEAAGQIPLENPDNYPEAEKTTVKPAPMPTVDTEGRKHPGTVVSNGSTFAIPRKPEFVFMAKNRGKTQFCTKKDLVKTTLQWEASGVRFDLFELSPRAATVKVDIGDKE